MVMLYILGGAASPLEPARTMQQAAPQQTSQRQSRETSGLTYLHYPGI